MGVIAYSQVKQDKFSEKRGNFLQAKKKSALPLK
jgi:hypothetical protein